MNQIYPKFIVNALGAMLAGSGPDSAPTLYFYALKADYVFDPAHETLSDVTPAYRLAKSDAIDGTIQADGSVSIPAVVDAFNRAELIDVAGLILVSEWTGGDALVFYMNVWTNTGLPFSAPAQVNIEFDDDFAFRLGSVAPIVIPE